MSVRRLTGAALRGSIAFLLLVWLATRPAVQAVMPLDHRVVATAALIGLPLAALVAGLVTLRRGTRGGWRRGAAAAAVAVALVFPVAMLTGLGASAPGRADPLPAAFGTGISAPEAEPEQELEPQAEAAGDRAYRLRVRGLHPLIESAAGGRARVEIGARMDEAGSGCVIIEAQLLDEDSGRTLWQKAYRGDGNSPAAIRRVVAEALREAMSLTREGAGGEGKAI